MEQCQVARIEFIKTLRTFTVSVDGQRVYYDSDNEKSLDCPFLRPTLIEFPCLLYANGVPWAEANKYLLESISQKLTNSVFTSKSIAIDLLRFLKFLELEGIEFKKDTLRKPLSPLHRFRYELKQQVEEGALASSTADRCVGRIANFYTWMFEEGLVSSRLLPDKSHKTKYRMVSPGASSVVKLKNRKKKRDSLKPLNKEQQIKLIEVLKSSNNIEMKLIVITVLLTGLRLQSVLTLKTHIFSLIEEVNESYFSVAIGGNTGIDTKFSKPMVVHFPVELMCKLNLYASSQRAALRKEKSASHLFKKYVFITNRGHPYYITNHDRKTLCGEYSSEGGGVGMFLKRYIIPELGFSFSLHDLRATYAMNLTDSQLSMVQSGEINLNQAHLFVRDMLGHTSTDVTDRYLNYRQLQKQTGRLQCEYEKEILDIL